MQLREVYVEGYRSLKGIRYQIDMLSVLVGKNAAGKTNLYRALALLQAAADGSICRKIAEEGGVDSVLFAGGRATEHRHLKIGGVFDGFEYEIEIDLPGEGEAALELEPMIRSETLRLGYRGTRINLVERKGPLLQLRDDRGGTFQYERRLLASETALFAVRDHGRFPELALVRQSMLDWRFYHDIRTDVDAPVRTPSLGLSAPTLSSDGSDLAAVLATIYYVKGDSAPIRAAVADAFPGAELIVAAHQGKCRFALRFPEIDRPFAAHELSDGTLRYLYLIGALLSYRPASFIAINEPEASLHTELLPPLARLIVDAAARSQIWVVTHSEMLAAQIARYSGVMPRLVTKEDGATAIRRGIKERTPKMPTGLRVPA